MRDPRAKLLPRAKSAPAARLLSRQLDVPLTALQGGLQVDAITQDGDESGGSRRRKWLWAGPTTDAAGTWGCHKTKKGEPATELLFRVARRSGAATLWLLSCGKKKPNFEPLLRDSNGLRRLEHASLACGATMRPRCRCAVLQAYVWALLLLLFAAADGEFCPCNLFFPSCLFLPLTWLPRQLSPSWGKIKWRFWHFNLRARPDTLTEFKSKRSSLEYKGWRHLWWIFR